MGKAEMTAIRVLVPNKASICPMVTSQEMDRTASPESLDITVLPVKLRYRIRCVSTNVGILVQTIAAVIPRQARSPRSPCGGRAVVAEKGVVVAGVDVEEAVLSGSTRKEVTVS